MEISVREARVKSATVEVKVLSLSGKQVTLAVFRQLEDERLLDERTGDLRGQPWGRVNYHPDKWCQGAEEHLHVVWQKGELLRRAHVSFKHPYCKDGSRFDKLACDLWIAKAIEGWKPSPIPWGEQKPKYHGRTAYFSVPKALYEYWCYETTEARKQLFSLYRERCGAGVTPRQIETQLIETANGITAFSDKWATHYSALSELDQLFIAI